MIEMSPKAGKDFKVGDLIRSHDFALKGLPNALEGERATFIEGIIIGIGDMPGCAVDCPHLHIEVGRSVVGGFETMRLIGDTCYPPLDYSGFEGPV